MKEMKANSADKIFTSNIEALRRKINRYLQDVLGLDHSSHDFRHTKITELANSGLPTKTIQSYVGHSSSVTTTRYINVDQDEAVRQVTLASEKLKKKREKAVVEEIKVDEYGNKHLPGG